VVCEVLKKLVDQKIELDILREGKQIKIPVITEKMASEPGERKAGQPEMKEWFGLRVRPITPVIAKQLGLAKAEGVVIAGVESESVAQEIGLREGAVILEVNCQKIRNEEDYQSAMGKVKPDKAVLLLIGRGNSTFFVSLAEKG
jgi:serine protease Do